MTERILDKMRRGVYYPGHHLGPRLKPPRHQNQNQPPEYNKGHNLRRNDPN